MRPHHSATVRPIWAVSRVVRLAYIPFFGKVIRQGDLFPLIRAARDCV
jgi:hypothetical protein